MSDASLFRALLDNTPTDTLRMVMFNLLPGVTFPRGSKATLSKRFMDWLMVCNWRLLPNACDTIASSLEKAVLRNFLCTRCGIAVLASATKTALATRLVHEVLADARALGLCAEDHVDRMPFHDDASAKRLRKRLERTWTKGAGVDDHAGEVVVPFHDDASAKRLRKRLKRTWIKGARELRRRVISCRIKSALAMYTLTAFGDHTLVQVRHEVADHVGMSLESGQSRMFFERRLEKHLRRLPQKYRRGQRRAQANLRVCSRADGDPLAEYHEMIRMHHEDVLSEALC